MCIDYKAADMTRVILLKGERVKGLYFGVWLNVLKITIFVGYQEILMEKCVETCWSTS